MSKGCDYDCFNCKYRDCVNEHIRKEDETAIEFADRVLEQEMLRVERFENPYWRNKEVEIKEKKRTHSRNYINRKAAKTYYKKHKEKIAKYQHDYYLKNKERILERARARRGFQSILSSDSDVVNYNQQTS